MKREDFKQGNIYTFNTGVYDYVFQWLGELDNYNNYNIGAFTGTELWLKNNSINTYGLNYCSDWIYREATKEEIEVLLQNSHFKPELYNPELQYEVY